MIARELKRAKLVAKQAEKRKALKAIKVDYEVLPHVTDVDEAIGDGAPVLHEGRSNESVPEGASPNIMARYEFGHGDIEAGLAQADRDEGRDRCHP